VGIPIISALNWVQLLNIQNDAIAHEVRSSVLVVATAFCIGIPLTAFQRVATGLQLGWLTSASASVGSILSLLFVLVASFLKMNLVSFIMMVVISPLLANLFLALMLRSHIRFFTVQKHLIDHGLALELFRNGSMFLIPQIAATLMNAVPVVILSSVSGPAAVTPYSLAHRIIGLANQGVGMVLTPLWPAYAEAFVREDINWIKKTFRLSLLLVGLGIPLPCLAFWFYGESLIRLWSSYKGEIGFWFLGAMAAWFAVTTVGQACAMFLNALGRLRGQAIYGTVFVGCAILLLRTVTERFGLVGIPVTMTLCYIVINLSCTLAECKWICRKVLV
jgi:O-antigen/teichoic acid export membrane protein